MSTLILALNYWLHLLATVVWLGGLAMLVIVAWPGARLLAERGVPGGEADRAAARRHLRRLAAVNLALGALVLMLTAYVTAL